MVEPQPACIRGPRQRRIEPEAARPGLPGEPGRVHAVRGDQGQAARIGGRGLEPQPLEQRGAADREDLVAVIGHRSPVLEGRTAVADGQIDPLLAQIPGRILGHQLQLDLGVQGPEIGQPRQQPEVAEGQRGAHRHRVRRERLADGLDHLGHAPEGPGDGGGQRRALGRQHHPAVSAQEEGRVQVGLKELDLAADRGLRHPELIRGEREALEPRRRLEGGERAEGGNAAAKRKHRAARAASITGGYPTCTDFCS